MSSTDEIKAVLLQETGHDLLPKCEGHASIIASPQFRILMKKKKNVESQLWKKTVKKQNNMSYGIWSGLTG